MAKKSGSYFQRFIAGEKGHSHAAEEFGSFAVASSLLGWLVSPLANVVLIFVVFLTHKKMTVLPFVGDKYWIDREIKQSKAMVSKGRRNPPSDPADLERMPAAPTDFWTLDARADVLFPRKLRVVWYILALAYSVFIFFRMGL